MVAAWKSDTLNDRISDLIEGAADDGTIRRRAPLPILNLRAHEKILGLYLRFEIVKVFGNRGAGFGKPMCKPPSGGSFDQQESVKCVKRFGARYGSLRRRTVGALATMEAGKGSSSVCLSEQLMAKALDD